MIHQRVYNFGMAKNRTVQRILKLHPDEKTSIDMNAESCGLSVVEYLVRINKDFGSKMIEKYGDKK